jgi:hypothetical protein
MHSIALDFHCPGRRPSCRIVRRRQRQQRFFVRTHRPGAAGSARTTGASAARRRTAARARGNAPARQPHFLRAGRSERHHVHRMAAADGGDTFDYAGTSRWSGMLGGAQYKVEVPKNWNGKLVMYAHGYAGESNLLAANAPSIRRTCSSTATPGPHRATARTSTTCARAWKTPTRWRCSSTPSPRPTAGATWLRRPHLHHRPFDGRPHHRRGDRGRGLRHRQPQGEVQRRGADVRRGGRHRAVRLLRRRAGGGPDARGPSQLPDAEMGGHCASSDRSAVQQVRRQRHHADIAAGRAVRIGAAEPDRRQAPDVRPGPEASGARSRPCGACSAATAPSPAS